MCAIYASGTSTINTKLWPAVFNKGAECWLDWKEIPRIVEREDVIVDADQLSAPYILGVHLFQAISMEHTLN